MKFICKELGVRFTKASEVSMELSSWPEWKLTPVRLVEPGPDVAFPRLFTPERQGDSLIAWLKDHSGEVDATLRDVGAMVFRGFDLTSEQAFQRAAGMLSGALESSYGDLIKRESAQFVYDATVYPQDRAILFHNEGSHTPRLPTRQFFYCGRAQCEGGETPILDCRALYQALPAELRSRFESQGLIYVRNFIRGVDVRWQDFFRTDSRSEVERACRAQNVQVEWQRDGSLRTRTRAPAVIVHPGSGARSFCNQIMLHHIACLDAKTAAALRAVLAPEQLPRNVLFGDGSAIPDEVVGDLLKLSVRHAVRFRWQPGDLLMLDNLATAHARSPFSGDRQILVAIGDVVSRQTFT